MAFENLRAVLRAGAGPVSKLKLALAAGATSRPGQAWWMRRILKAFSRRNRVWITFYNNGEKRKFSLRLHELGSDMLAFYELGSGDCYRLPKHFTPGCIIDCGANIGLFTIAALARWPQARAILCAPLPENLAQIEAHLQANSILAELHGACLGAEAGVSKFFVRDAVRGSMFESDPAVKTIDVRVETLSAIYNPHRDIPCIIKLDIEGAEIQVLEEFLAVPRKNCFFIGELHHWAITKDKFERILTQSGFKTEYFQQDAICVLFHAYPDKNRRESLCAI